MALLVMAILASLSWQGLDGILRARDGTREAIDRTTRLATVLTQWEQDLQAVHDTGVVPALAFDGQTLRLTRRVDAGVALVAWSVRGGVWQRWAGPGHDAQRRAAAGLAAQLPVAGQRARAPAGWPKAASQLAGLLPPRRRLDQRAVHRRPRAGAGAQPPAASAPSAPSDAASAPVAAPVAREALPDAVRLVITLDGRHAHARHRRSGRTGLMNAAALAIVPGAASAARHCCWR